MLNRTAWCFSSFQDHRTWWCTGSLRHLWRERSSWTLNRACCCWTGMV